ncbi:Pimeloyl-ACP methyl ester carboxylesterase [Microbacterium sp. cf046]|nr:Pimeloyl-ACP methyl ester carboxylesterase [Microbacterium sp. cf046]
MSDFLIVNGAWHSGWPSEPVARHLREAGHRAFSPTLPGLAHDDDPTKYTLPDVFDYLVDFTERNDLRDVTLIGHSWAGSVVSAVAPRIARRMSKLIYWASWVPAGLPMSEDTSEGYREFFKVASAASGNSTISVPLEVWQAAFINDAPAAVQEVTHRYLVAHPMQYFSHNVSPLDTAALGVPTAFVLGSEDVCLPADGEHSYGVMMARAGVAEATPAPGSHEAMFTDPVGLAEAFLHV